jgi:pimeloyl-ACP methyl ester carboxylesterase
LKRCSYILRILFILGFGMMAPGCNNYVAENFVRAPNSGQAIRGLDAPESVLIQHRVAEQLRVNVGPPTASLSVWIVNSVSAPVSLSLDPGPSPRDGPTVRMTMLPQTQPSIQTDRPPKGTVFLLHGLDDTKEDVPYQFYSYGLACEGYRVVLVDLRGHGRSTGDHIGYGGYEAHDLSQVLDLLQSRGLIAGKVGVLGISYGASVGICWAALDPRVKVVVALEPFSSIRFASQDAGATMMLAFRWLFSKNDYQDITNRIGRIDGFDPDKASPLYAIAHMKTPVLLIHGKMDDFLYPEHSIRLHAAAPDHSQLILVDGADHFDLWYKAVTTIMNESNDWFERYLTQ